jgi:hypothetical protein
MTNREAYGIYLRCQLENGVRAIEDLSDYVFMAWNFRYKDAAVGEDIKGSLLWFWHSYGGKAFGKGIDNVVRWLGAEFSGDIEAEKAKWSKYNEDWAKAITAEFGELKDEKKEDNDAE